MVLSHLLFCLKLQNYTNTSLEDAGKCLVKLTYNKLYFISSEILKIHKVD